MTLTDFSNAFNNLTADIVKTYQNVKVIQAAKTPEQVQQVGALPISAAGVEKTDNSKMLIITAGIFALIVGLIMLRRG